MRLLAFFAVLIVLLWFFLPNVREDASIYLAWPLSRTYRMPQAMALFASYFVGILTFYIISLFRDFVMRAQVNKLRKENRRLQDELERMRRAPIEDLGGSFETGGGGPQTRGRPEA
jgi:uncharacterized integral membrane protein